MSLACLYRRVGWSALVWLLTTVGALAQVGQVAMVTAPAPAFNFPGTPAAIYSTRKVVAAYAGKAVNIRRASDNTTTDIGFAGSDFDISAAQSFCASTQCYVAKWYDQSGGGQDATQATLATQPYLLISGGRAWVAFANTFLKTANAIVANGDQTIGVVMTEGDSHNTQTPIADFDGSLGWFLDVNGSGGSLPKQGGYWSNGGGFVNGASNMVAQAPSRLTIARASGALTVYVNGTSIATAAGQTSSAPTGGLTIGGFNGTPSFQGILSEVFIYASALSSTNRTAIDSNEAAYWPNLGFQTPYQGAAWFQTNATDNANAGNVLDYEYTQAWTVFAAVQLYSGGQQPQVIFSNVPASGPAFPGYELWVNQFGRLVVRIIHDFSGGAYIEVDGSTNLWDGKKHFVAASYDGSGTAAGVKLYVDGVAETNTTVLDTLAGGTIIAAGQSFVMGAQQGSNPLLGMMGHFQVDNLVRSPSYIASHATSSSLPPIDANTAISIAFTEGTGTTAADASGNSHTATLSNANLWVP